MTEKVAVYARVSTSGQAERHTIKQQLPACEDLCARQGYEVVEVFKDEAASGALPLEERPEGKRLMEAASQGRFSKVIVYCVDRLARDLVEGVIAQKQLEERGASLEFVTQSFDATPEGEFTFTLFLGLGELERKVIARRLKKGRDAAIAQGQFAGGGQAPFGYKVDYNADSKTHHLAIDEAEAVVVQRIFRSYVQEGLSHKALAQRLTDEGIQRRNGRGKGTTWYPAHVNRLLKNRAYIGEAHHGKTKWGWFMVKDRNLNKERKTEKPVKIKKWVQRPVAKKDWVAIKCPRIIADPLWKAAQARAKRNRRESQRPKDAVSEFLLGGLLRCQPCGGGMFSHSKVSQDKRNGKTYSYRYYGCGKQHKDETECRQPELVRAEKVEEAVFGAIVKAFSDPQHVLRACRAYGRQLA